MGKSCPTWNQHTAGAVATRDDSQILCNSWAVITYVRRHGKTGFSSLCFPVNLVVGNNFFISNVYRFFCNLGFYFLSHSINVENRPLPSPLQCPSTYWKTYHASSLYQTCHQPHLSLKHMFSKLPIGFVAFPWVKTYTLLQCGVQNQTPSCCCKTRHHPVPCQHWVRRNTLCFRHHVPIHQFQ